MTNNDIPSPYNIAAVTQEVLNKVLEMTKSKSVFIVVSDERLDHECGADCKGHLMNINTIGFTPSQLLGIAQVLVKNSGYKIVATDEE